MLKVSEADVMKFHAEMSALNSEKEQRLLLKKFLMASGALALLRAGQARKSASTSTGSFF